MSQLDVQKIWGALDWDNASIDVLRQEIELRQKEGCDLNQKAIRFVHRDETVLTSEEYTLMDILRERRQFAPKKQEEHWNKVMSLMRSKGAKCACALQHTKTPAQAILTELGMLKKRERILIKQLQKMRD